MTEVLRQQLTFFLAIKRTKVLHGIKCFIQLTKHVIVTERKCRKTKKTASVIVIFLIWYSVFTIWPNTINNKWTFLIS